MAIPKHANPRAHKFFESCHVGSRLGENGTSRSIDWNSTHPELQPTAVVNHGNGNPVCGYCGEAALPIQSHTSYAITGHTCVCVKAMDEIDWRQKHSELLERQVLERQRSQQEAPVINKDVIQRVMDIQHQAIKKHLSEKLPDPKLFLPHGIYFATPLSHFTDK